jgi:hypothetical protein
MAAAEKSAKSLAWLLGLAGLLVIGGAVTAVALAVPDYAVPAGGLLGFAVVGSVWGGFRARSRNRLRAVLDAFADRELTRQQ